MDFLSRHLPSLAGATGAFDPHPACDAATDLDHEAVGYLRVSDKTQLETGADHDPDGNSIATQREAIERSAAAMGVTITHWYIEPGISALPLDQRPKFREMLDRIVTKKDVKFVFVYMLSRLSRNRFEDAIVGLTLERLGVTVISAKEPVNGKDPATRMMRGMLAVINQYSSEASSVDIREKLAHKAQTGGTIGYAPLGYLNVRRTFEGRAVNTIAVDPDRAPYVTDIFTLYATGLHSFADIRELVTTKGLRTRPTKKRPHGTPIAVGTIGKILTDTYYLGYVTYQGIEYDGRHEPLVTPETFDTVQRVLATNVHSGIRRRVHSHPLKGLIWCSRCSRRLVITNATGNGGTYGYMMCMGRQHKTCDLPYLTADGVTAAVSAHLDTITMPPLDREAILADIHAALEGRHALTAHSRDTLTTTITELEARRARLTQLASHPEWDHAELTEQMRTIRAEHIAATRALAALHAERDTGRDVVTIAVDMLTQPRQVYDIGSDPVKTLLVKTMFGKVYVDTSQDTGTVVTPTTHLAEPFADLTDLPHPRRAPDTATDTCGGGVVTDTAPTRTPSKATRTAVTSGSSNTWVVGLTGFEPATP
ncbi:recombinase family protein [Actinokineospora sp. NBRC 105648]|uniref:recombinase family protein n=1 Tax=Actinokineospora sp. NBRC 105648 TaxID=3032206 RepID=UPI0024A1364C|nr:recombinase family protein [Actinokineospora sp. NBRC 105648]GLZ41405.1 recombinase [Actinokineospora sp. NBRC 105648]